jgi:pSer/pThr/pTyr-binding forkhead associated (FHA) protein
MNNQHSDLNPTAGFTSTYATILRKDLAMELRLHVAGKPFVSNQEQIFLQINNTNLTLPIQEQIIIGRYTDTTGTPQPDVDLSAFELDQKSVSRCHARIEWRGTLIYVTDLFSSNGTWLNGLRLIPNAARLLRDGDDLRLGELSVKVKFTL